ncbi:MAG TPA: hypothetical protein EYQ18_02055 [Candidatus Handelsmanbacteria bacterium]|nr:hypothetical protein [Candidatus Handelsmanbacteria bacterium]
MLSEPGAVSAAGAESADACLADRTIWLIIKGMAELSLDENSALFAEDLRANYSRRLAASGYIVLVDSTLKCTIDFQDLSGLNDLLQGFVILTNTSRRDGAERKEREIVRILLGGEHPAFDCMPAKTIKKSGYLV